MSLLGNQNGSSRGLAVIAAVLCAVIVFFQNCGGFKASSSGASDGMLSLDSGSTSVVKGAVFRVTANTLAYSDSTKFVWDHEFGDGLTYCQQTTSSDKKATDFYCPGEGKQVVTLTAYLDNGTKDTHTIEVLVGSVADSGTVDGGTGGGVTATPTPVPGATEGQTLYQTNCSGCHGNLIPVNQSNKSKRGVTLTLLNNAIASRSDMASLSVLTTVQRNLIVEALQ